MPGSDGIVYTADVERGIDILRFAKPKAGATFMAPAPVRTNSAKLRFGVRPRSQSALRLPGRQPPRSPVAPPRCVRAP